MRSRLTAPTAQSTRRFVSTNSPRATERSLRGNFTYLHRQQLFGVNIDQETLVLERVRKLREVLCGGSWLVRIPREAKRDTPHVTTLVGIPLNLLHSRCGLIEHFGGFLLRDINRHFRIDHRVTSPMVARNRPPTTPASPPPPYPSTKTRRREMATKRR